MSELDRMPVIGSIVLYDSKGQINSNGTDKHPAIVNRVWNDRGCVNLTVFPDCGPPISRTSVLPGGITEGDNSPCWYWTHDVEPKAQAPLHAVA